MRFSAPALAGLMGLMALPLVASNSNVEFESVEVDSATFQVKTSVSPENSGSNNNGLFESVIESVAAVFGSSSATNANSASKNVMSGSTTTRKPLMKEDIKVSTDSASAWAVHTLDDFPGYSLRVKKQDAQLCDPDVNQYVGYIDVAPGANSKLSAKKATVVPPSLDADDKHFFFWFFESRRAPESDPLVLWLNGGPGCSSMMGLLMELGPCRPTEGGNGTVYNEYSWNKEANIIFLDQPINVGFSYSENADQVSNTVDAADDVYAFLQLFLTKFNKYSKLPFHVTGESYAGHYIPAIGKKIFDENNELKDSSSTSAMSKKIEINLESLAIGNGLTDPLVQYKYYADYAADETYGPLLSEEEIAGMRSKFGTCGKLIETCYQYENRFSCVPPGLYCNNALIGPFQSTGLNIYDVRQKCDREKNPLCYEIMNDIEAYLNDERVQAALGVDRTFESCKMDINGRFAMAGDWMRPYVRDLPPLLDAGLKVLIYAGDADFICNWIGNKAWITELEWSGHEEFAKAKDVTVKSSITGRESGVLREYKNLSFLRVFEAGHMVPYDQPEHSSEFINAWIGA